MGTPTAATHTFTYDAYHRLVCKTCGYVFRPDLSRFDNPGEGWLSCKRTLYDPNTHPRPTALYVFDDTGVVLVQLSLGKARTLNQAVLSVHCPGLLSLRAELVEQGCPGSAEDSKPHAT